MKTKHAVEWKKMLLIFTAVVLLVEAAVLWGRRGISAERIRGELIGVMQSCVARDRSAFDPACFRKRITPLVSSRTIGPMVDALGKLFESDQAVRSYAILTCHTPSHIIGEAAIAKGITFPEVLSQCSRSCDYGCIHGALNATLRGEKQFLDTFPTLCDVYNGSDVAKDKASCAHVIGHTIAEMYNRNASTALGTCDKFADPQNRFNCGQGAVMQYVFGSLDKPDRFSGDADALFAFCQSLPGSYRGTCFDGIGAFAYRLYKDPKTAESLCSRVPDSSRNNCYQSIGVWAYFQYASDPAGLVAYCQGLGRDVEFSCIRGAIVNTVSLDKTNRYAVRLCGLVADDRRSDCFGAIGKEYEWAYGKGQRSAVCSGLEDKKNATSCMEAP